MGGRGASGASGASGAGAGDYSRGSGIASALGVSEERGDEVYDVIQNWANSSTGIKNAQRGGSHAEQDARDAASLEEFIEKSPSHQGELVRAMAVPDSTTYRKNGKIRSDGSIASWTVPSNLEAAKTFVKESDRLVVLHVSATKGADTRSYSNLAGLDSEIIQTGGYEGSLRELRRRSLSRRSGDTSRPAGPHGSWVVLAVAAGDYTLTEFPDDATLEREARACPLLAHCPDRTFSFCLKTWVNVDHKLMFRKVTFKHCYECIHADEIGADR